MGSHKDGGFRVLRGYLLESSWVDCSGVVSRVGKVIMQVAELITRLIPTHETFFY